MIPATSILTWVNELINIHVATPGGISCYTPSDTGPPTPLAASSPSAIPKQAKRKSDGRSPNSRAATDKKMKRYELTILTSAAIAPH